MYAIALELNVYAAKLGDLCMEAMFLEFPPLGLKNIVPMDEVVLGACFGIGNPFHDNDYTTL